MAYKKPTELETAQRDRDHWKMKYIKMSEILAPWKEPDANARKLWDTYNKGQMGYKFTPDKETLSKIYKLASIQCTQKEIATHLGVSPKYFGELKTKYPEVEAAFDVGRADGKIYLRELQFEQSLESVPMSIHLGKHVLDQTDKIKQEITGNSELLKMLMALPEVIETIEGPKNTFTPIEKDED